MPDNTWLEDLYCLISKYGTAELVEKGLDCADSRRIMELIEREWKRLAEDVRNMKKELEDRDAYVSELTEKMASLESSKEEALEDSTQMLEAIFNAIPDIIGIQDNRHNIIRYNNAGYEYLNMNSEGVRGKKCYSLIGRKTQCRVCPTARVYKTKKAAHFRKYIEEQQMWFDVRSYPILDREGNVVKIVEHLRDITEEKRAEDELRKAREELEKRVEERTAQLAKANRKLEEDIKKRESVEDALLKENIKFSAILSNMDDGVFFIDCDDVIQEANDSICQFLDLKRETFLGEKLNYLFRNVMVERKEENRGIFKDSRVTEKILGIIQSFRDKKVTGSVDLDNISNGVDVMVRLKPIYLNENYSGTIINVINITEVVTAKRRAEEALQNALRHRKEAEESRRRSEKSAEELKTAYEAIENSKIEAERANKSKSEFLANMSHEIRTPMNAILGFSDVLLDSNLPEEQRDYVNFIKNSGNHLLMLINDILDLSKIEAGKMKVDVTPFNLHDLIKETVDLLRFKMKEKKLKCRMFIDDEIPKVLIGDSKHIRQILLNLLSNAVKFTNKGGITITAGESMTSNAGEGFYPIAIEVQDTGIGISPEKIETIFDPFDRGSKSTDRNYEGTGLGLAITQKLVKMMEGEIHVSSRLGRGTTFEVELPLKTEEIPEFQNISQIRAEQSIASLKTGGVTKKRKVLIVDDDNAIRELMKYHFKSSGFETVTAASGEEVFEILRRDKPDLVLLDIILPGMSGWDVLKAMKDNREYSSIPVMMCSVLSENRESFSLGAVDYIEKPIDMKEIVEKVESILSKTSDRSDMIIIEDSPEFNRLLVQTFEKSGFNVCSFFTAEDALQYISGGMSVDVVILDLMLPGIDGFEFLKRLECNLPVLVYTSKELDEENMKILNGYFCKILRKDRVPVKGLVEEVSKFIDETVARPVMLKTTTPEAKKGRPFDKNMTCRRIRDIHSGHFSYGSASVLLVEDNPVNQKLIETYLKGVDVKLSIASDGIEALDIALNNDFDLIFMDIQLPKMNGYEVTRRIRGNCRNHDTPIIALTAHAMKGDSVKAEKAGCDAYISKPIEKRKFLEVVWEYVKKVKDKQVDPIKAHPELDPEIAALIPWYKGILQEDVNIIKKALNEGDYETIEYKGHNLKGNGKSFGFDEVSEIGARIEAAAKAKTKNGVKPLLNRLECEVFSRL